MHFDPDALFDDRRRAPGVRAAVVGTALVANQLASSPLALATVCAAGIGAFVLECRGHARYLLALGVAQAVVMLAASHFAVGDDATALRLSLRFLAGLAWVLWFSSTVSWPALKATLRRHRFPEALLDAVDRTIAHALLLGEELVRRRTAATVRLALAPGQPHLEAYSLILAGGVESAMDRAARLDEARELRSATPSPTSDAEHSIVSLRGVSVEHGDGFRAVAEVDLDVRRGEWLAVAGPSGAGKSTLLELLAGVLAPSKGELRRFGALVGKTSMRERVDGRVALVFQDPSDQLFGATPLEDLIWGLRRRGVAQHEACERACHVLEQLGIFELRNRSQSRLSVGERKRAAFAAALVVEPELLLCDEPTSNLDPVAARRLIRAVERSAAARGTTVLWVSHDLALLPTPVRRIVLLREGRVSFDGPIAEGLTLPRLQAAGLALPEDDLV
jgi:cobalt/nickel transport system ATP-binding protein